MITRNMTCYVKYYDNQWLLKSSIPVDNGYTRAQECDYQYVLCCFCLEFVRT